MLTLILALMNVALLTVGLRATIKQRKAEKRARWAVGALAHIKSNMDQAKSLLDSVVGKPIMVRTDINQPRNFYLN